MAQYVEHTKHGRANEVRLYGDHDVRMGIQLQMATASKPGLAILKDKRYIVKAGTLYPANDATAIGLIAADVDVTDGDANASLIMHGVINSANLPAQPSAEAKAALKNIQFVNNN